MNEVRNHWKKWIYWFLLGVAIIIVYKALDSFGDVMNVVGKFFSILGPFFAGIFIAYLLFMPCKKIEKLYEKSKSKLIKKKARTLSVATVYLIVILLIMVLFSVILPVVVESVADLFNQILGFLKKFASAVFKDKTYQNIDKYFNDSNEIFFKFIASQFLDAIVVGSFVTIAMTIMRIKYAPLLGFFIGLFNMIPYFGAIIAVGISAIITLITGGFTQAIWMLIVVIILQQIDANIINPKIIGKSLKISPLLVIFAVTVGGAYFGILGMFLAVPVIAVVKILVEDYVNLKLAEKKKEKQKI